jgi:hypothetical protein
MSEEVTRSVLSVEDVTRCIFAYLDFGTVVQYVHSISICQFPLITNTLSHLAKVCAGIETVSRRCSD